jgi:hypothetical protein
MNSLFLAMKLVILYADIFNLIIYIFCFSLYLAQKKNNQANQASGFFFGFG